MHRKDGNRYRNAHARKAAPGTHTARRALAGLMALPLLVLPLLTLPLLTGCGAGNGHGPDGTPGVSAETATEAVAASTRRDPVTFTLFIGETNSNADGFQSPVAKRITELTGVTLDIEYLASGDEKQRMALMVASGKYPDLVFAKGNLQTLKDAGAILRLDDRIEKSIHIKGFYGDNFKRLRYSTADPGIYCLGGKEGGGEPAEPTTGFLLQHRVVEALGYPRLKTLDDYEQAIRTYLAAHPETDGKPTVGLSLLADDWRAMISLTNPACFATGGPDDGEWYIDPDTDAIIRHLTRPEERAYFRWLNRMNAEGLLDPESFVQQYDQYLDKIATGRVLALADARWNITDAQTRLRQAGMDDRMYGHYPLTLTGDVDYREFQSTGYIGGWGISITTACRDPQRAFDFLDWFHSEEAQILTHWGIEGVHWDTVDGRRAMRPEVVAQQASDPYFPKKTGISLYTYPFPSYGNTVLDSSGQRYEAFVTPEAIQARQTETENRVLAAYGAKMWKDLYPAADTWPAKTWGAAWTIKMEDQRIQAMDATIVDIGIRMIPQAVLAPPEAFDARWDAYLAAIRDAGLDQVAERMQEALKERIALWNE